MSDIAKCERGDCKVKHKCYRYTAKAAETHQTYVFIDEKDLSTGCVLFWSNECKLAYWFKHRNKKTCKLLNLIYFYKI